MNIFKRLLLLSMLFVTSFNISAIQTLSCTTSSSCGISFSEPLPVLNDTPIGYCTSPFISEPYIIQNNLPFDVKIGTPYLTSGGTLPNNAVTIITDCSGILASEGKPGSTCEVELSFQNCDPGTIDRMLVVDALNINQAPLKTPIQTTSVEWINTNTDDLPLDGSTINALIDGTDGEIFAGTDDGNVFFWNASSWSNPNDMPLTTTDPIITLVYTNNGYLYAGTGMGFVWEWNGHNWHQLTSGATCGSPSGSLDCNVINALTYDITTDTVYAGTGAGNVWSWDGVTWTLTNGSPLNYAVSENGLLFDSNTKLLFAGTDNGTGELGNVYIYDTSAISPSWTLTTGLDGTAVLDFLDTGNIYAGTNGNGSNNGGIYIFDVNTSTWTSTGSIPASPVIGEIVELVYDTTEHKIYAGAQNGYVLRLDASGWTNLTPSTLDGTGINALVYSPADEYIYAGTAAGKIWSWNAASWVQSSLGSDLDGTNILELLYNSAEETVFAGTVGGDVYKKI